MAAWTRINWAKVGANTNPTQIAAIDFSGADVIAGFLATYGSGVVSASDFSDPGFGNTFVIADQLGAAGDGSMRLAAFYIISPVTGASYQMQYNAAFFAGLIVGAWTQGSAPTARTATKFGGTGGLDSTIKAGSIGQADDLVIPGAAWYSNNGSSIDLSFNTPLEQAYAGGNNIGDAISWKQVSGAVDPQWTFGGTNVCAAINMAFSGTGVGPPPNDSRIIFRNRNYV